jgi:hypothetical protein
MSNKSTTRRRVVDKAITFPNRHPILLSQFFLLIAVAELLCFRSRLCMCNARSAKNNVQLKKPIRVQENIYLNICNNHGHSLYVREMNSQSKRRDDRVLCQISPPLQEPRPAKEERQLGRAGGRLKNFSPQHNPT